MKKPLPKSFRSKFPFQSHFLRLSSGARLHYVDEGRENLTIFLHDIPFWSFYFRNLIVDLRDNFRCLAPDYVGFGLSDKPSRRNYSLRTITNDVVEFLTKLDVGKFNLVLHGWGAVPGMAIATRWAERVNRIAIFNGNCFPGYGMSLSHSAYRTGILGKFFANFLNVPIREAVSSTHCDGPSHDGYLFPYRSWASRTPTRTFLGNLPTYEESKPGGKWLRELSEKIFILSHKKFEIFWGVNDRTFPVDVLDKWKAELGEVQPRLFHNSGHHILEDEYAAAAGPLRHLLAGGIEAKIPSL
ncbi:MAG: alpha/beta fold hydrolase [Puniceicoccales bacterium]|jgi:haloalkane dehalogenase|nr:alpha/beta fold hydrolase [Puniceicoccales bacterium]